MKSSKIIFKEYIDKAAREWWKTISKREAYPYHSTQTPWQLIPESAKWTIYGLYVDKLRNIGINGRKERLVEETIHKIEKWSKKYHYNLNINCPSAQFALDEILEEYDSYGGRE